MKTVVLGLAVAFSLGCVDDQGQEDTDVAVETEQLTLHHVAKVCSLGAATRWATPERAADIWPVDVRHANVIEFSFGDGLTHVVTAGDGACYGHFTVGREEIANYRADLNRVWNERETPGSDSDHVIQGSVVKGPPPPPPPDPWIPPIELDRVLLRASNRSDAVTDHMFDSLSEF